MEEALHLLSSSSGDTAWYWYGDFKSGVCYTRRHYARVEALVRLPEMALSKCIGSYFAGVLCIEMEWVGFMKVS